MAWQQTTLPFSFLPQVGMLIALLAFNNTNHKNNQGL